MVVIHGVFKTIVAIYVNYFISDINFYLEFISGDVRLLGLFLAR